MSGLRPTPRALLFKGPRFTPLFTMGSAQGIEAILSTHLTQPQVNLSQRREHLPAVAKFYQCDQPHWMWLMALTDFKPVNDCEAAPLGVERFDELRALYAASDAGAIFAPYQLATGYFFGVEADGRLVSVAGVQVASRRYRVDAIGNVATHLAYRGRGYATMATSAVVRALQSDGITTIVLTVEQSNRGAIRIYERLGFVKYGELMTGKATRKHQ